MYLIDLAQFGEWHQWLVNPEGDTLKIEILDYSPEKAVELTTKFDQLFATPDLQTPEDRAEELRKYLFLSVQERFTLEVSESAAARCIELAARSS